MKFKNWDKKSVIGTAILVVVLGAIIISFWSVVGRQAQLVKEEERKEEEMAITAIYIQTGELLKSAVFVDMENETIFTAQEPEEGMYTQKGSLDADRVPEHGDIVKIYGDGIMLQSFPGQYPNVTKMQMVRRANTEELKKYEDMVAENLG